jgi:hypothetical protein
MGLIKDLKLANVDCLPPKKAPKYSKNLEGLRYKK